MIKGLPQRKITCDSYKFGNRMKDILIIIFLFSQSQFLFSQESEYDPELYTKLVV